MNNPRPLHGASIAAGLASQFIVGGSGEAWAPALVEHATVQTSLSRATTLGLGIHHSRPILADAGVLFPEAAFASASGFRDELALKAHIDVAFDVQAQWPLARGVVSFFPRLGFAAGALFTDTQLELAGFSGPTAYRARAVSPLLGFGLAFEARAYEWISLVPRIDASVTIAADEREIEGGERWDAEWWFTPGVDILVWF